MQKDYTKLLDDFKLIPQHKRTKTFMEISGYSHYENICSNILAFYLNPSNEHGLKDLMLNSLMHLIEKDFCFDLHFEKIKIHREHRTADEKRLDLVIQTEKYAIGIENKIFHSLHNDLADYYKTIKMLCYDRRKPICIVLSLNKLTSDKDVEKVNNNNFVNITYEQVFQNVKQNIGKYINSSNIKYVSHLTDFIKSIENLIPSIMENKILWTFFKNNIKTIQELTESFDEYKKYLFEKLTLLEKMTPKNEFAPTADKQWIYDKEKQCLVHDYIINSKYKLAVDATIGVTGWEIEVFGRDVQSANFILNVMCRDSDFLPKPFEEYELRGDVLIFQKFDVDTDIADVEKTLTDLLARIEEYKKRTDKKCV